MRSNAVHQAQCDAAVQVRHRTCRRRSRWHVNQLRLRRLVWQWARRPRRLTPPPWPSPQGLLERAPAQCAWRRDRRGNGVPRPLRRLLLKWALLWARKRRHPVVHALFSSQRSVAARDAHSAEDWRRHALFMAWPSKVPSDGAGKSGARLRLDAALEPAEDGHVAGLQVRRASWREGCAVRCEGTSAFMAARVASLA